MKIIDIVKKPEKAYDIDFEKEESKIFFDLCNAIYRNCDIRSIVNAYFKNTDSLYNQLDEKWHNTITHNILVGRTIKGVFIRSLNSFKLSDYIDYDTPGFYDEQLSVIDPDLISAITNNKFKYRKRKEDNKTNVFMLSSAFGIQRSINIVKRFNDLFH